MLWIRDWITNSIVLPLIKQGRNRLRNIKVVNNADGTATFTNSEGVDVITGHTDVEITDIAKASEGCINPNPYFLLNDYDYEEATARSRIKIVSDVVSTNSKSLKVHGGTVSLLGTHKIAIPQGREYRAVCDVKFNDNGAADPDGKKANYYVGIACYDSSDNIILPIHLPNKPDNKLGILVNGATKGDTSLTITGTIDSYNNNDSTYHYRTLIFYRPQSNGELCYVGGSGRVYDHLGYSRWVLSVYPTGAYDKGSIVDNGDGTITIPLNVPIEWDMPAGSAVKSAQSGGTYNYWIIGKREEVDNKWHTYKSPWKEYKDGVHASDYAGNVARNGTAYVRLLLLPNYYIYNSADTALGYVSSEMPKLDAYYGTIALEWRSKR